MSDPSDRAHLPQRKRLPHLVPPWVAQGARHFITINALHRDAAPFAPPDIASALLQNLLAYDDLGKWHLWLAMVMPDHLHFIATFNLDFGLKSVVSSWKGYQTKALKLRFQSGFFEHRLRDDDEFVEKAAYIRENPVRKGLVADAAQWPFLYARVPAPAGQGDASPPSRCHLRVGAPSLPPHPALFRSSPFVRFVVQYP